LLLLLFVVVVVVVAAAATLFVFVLLQTKWRRLLRDRSRHLLPWGEN
jgi:hypothetical protein